MSEHTEGRIEAFTEESFSGWFALRQITDDGLNHEIGSGDGGLFELDARRLAACWNAFENVRTDLVELITMQASADAMEKLPAVQSELNAARALLREVLGDGYLSETKTHRIASYLDACDKPGAPDAS